MATPDRTKLVSSATALLKSRSLWGKLAGVMMTLLLLCQVYMDIRADIREVRDDASEAQEEVDQTEEKILNKGKLSEKTTAEAIGELQETMQFLYEEMVLMQDQMDDLSLNNKRLKARLDRYRDLSGIPPEEMEEDDLRDLARLLLPFMIPEPEYEAVGGGGVGVDGMGDSVALDGGTGEEEGPGVSPSAKSKKKSDRVDGNGKLKFDKEPAKAF